MVSIRILSSPQGYLQEVSVLFPSDLHNRYHCHLRGLRIPTAFDSNFREIWVRIGAFLSSQLLPDCVTAAAIGTFLQKKGASSR
jgi:hypothetical protein